jgi:hypothetical protein
MAVRKLDRAVADSRAGVTMRQDPTRIDPRKLKLGKGLARHDPRTLLLASYITPALPVPRRVSISRRRSALRGA